MKKELLQKLKIQNNRELELANVKFLNENNKISVIVEDNLSFVSCLELTNALFSYIDETSNKKIVKIEYVFEEENENFELIKRILLYNFNLNVSCSNEGKLIFSFLSEKDKNSYNWNDICWTIKGQGFDFDETQNIEISPQIQDNTLFDKYIANKKTDSYQEKVMANRMKEILAIDISNIPVTKDDLEEMENHFVKIKGQILDLESKKVKNGKNFLLTFKVTDFTDTISVRGFFKEELSYKNNDFVEITGMVKYDDYVRKIIVSISNPSDIKPTEPFGELLDEPELLDRERVELHTHTTFSTQDGLASVSEYYKRMKKFGIKGFAFTDHENIQAYPEIEKITKGLTETKPIYGVELNCFDQNDFKIFYQGTSSNKNILVGLDIETTGFSAVYENIIEISAFKTVDGKLFEYSTLVKLDDYSTLTPKITSLTSITEDMLKTSGIGINEALKGLVDFIDDGIIVAHNATFDVDFIQYQIKKHLNIEKNYSFIDTLNFSRVMLRNSMKRFGLGYVAKKLQIPLEEHHRAIYDAKCCYDICNTLLERLEVFDLDDVNCPKDGITEMSLKINSKDLKKVMDKFLEENPSLDVTTTDESSVSISATGRQSSRTNITYLFKDLSDDEMDVVGRLLDDNGKIKVVSSVKRINKYSSNYENLNELITFEDVLTHSHGEHVTVLVKNQNGLKDLYKLISYCHTKLISKQIMCTKEQLNKYRKNLLIGSACMNGIFRQIYEKDKNIDYSFYDYLEIQPKECYFGISDNPYKLDFIKDTVRKIAMAGAKNKKIICATSDAHYLDARMKEYRDVYIETPIVGGGLHPLFSASDTGMHKLMSSKEMLDAMNWYEFNPEFNEKIVFDNPEEIYNFIEKVQIVKDKLFTPTNEFLKGRILPIVGHEVTNVEQEMKNIVAEALKEYRFNGKLPKLIFDRVKKEMNSIIGNGFYITYYIAYLLVKKSNSDGYVVGSRGSVGSSFVANLMGITEVNSLIPHYHCPHCKYTIFQNETAKNNKEVSLLNNLSNVKDGFDLPDAVCPHCGQPLNKDGHDIPFETFLGFHGDKVPDIDLNFSGDYQWKAHNFCKEVFGKNNAFRAGTIATVAENTAIAYYKKYLEKRNINMRQEEIERRSKKMQNVKRTTGQHPGGIIVVPENFDVFDFTPVQYPANDSSNSWFTTHFDYHGVLDETLLKLDILGHDDPTILKFLMDKVHSNPQNYPFNDVKNIPLLNSEEITRVVSSSLGVPELGTNFVRGMLEDTRPNNFAELVKVSGLSHGTDVWTNNAQDLVLGKKREYGYVPFENVIGCRDDIMVTLMQLGCEAEKAFEIMEFIRKGKPSKDKETWNIHKEYLRSKRIPEWYIWSCEQIKYMFPKAHAVAYVLSALRIAWFKLYRPLDFYASFFTIRSLGAFDCKYIATSDAQIIESRIEELKQLKEDKALTQQEEDKIPYLEVALEMINRGFKFVKPDVNKSHAKEFLTDYENNSLIIPFIAMNGVGESSAVQVFKERLNSPYIDLDDLKKRGKADKKFIEGLKELEVVI